MQHGSTLLICLITLSVCAQPSQEQEKENLSYSIGVQAYLYGQPIMDLYRTFYENTLDPDRGHDVTLNEFNFVRRLITPSDKWVVSPNNDTQYNRAFCDLSKEPIVLHIPDMGDRYYWFPIGDMYHNLYHHLSWNTVGFKGGDFALCAPGWQGVLPEGIKRVDLTTNMIWTLGRYTVYGEDDVKNVTALQDQTYLVALSDFGKKPTPRAQINPANYPVFTRDDMDDPEKFFTVMNEVLRRNPPLSGDHALLGWFRQINLHPDQQFAWSELDEPTRRGLTRAVADALDIIKWKESDFANKVNGWVEAILNGDMSNDPVNHAGVTKMGLLYSQKEVSTYHVAYVDVEGSQLDGRNRYELHFTELPPVDAFWSVTMYDAETMLFIENEIDRYAIGDRTKGVVKNDDGSLTIYIQHDKPTDPDQISNWLPAPSDKFYLALREYSPKSSIYTREWVPPGIKKK